MRPFKNLLLKLRTWILDGLPPPKVIYMSNNIKPLSRERLEWLIDRRKVLIPVVNTLKNYVNSSAAGISNTNIAGAVSSAQSELLMIEVEIGVLEEFFAKQAATPTSAIAPVLR